jgi:hypothetical protein
MGYTTGYSRSVFPAERNVYSTMSSQRLEFIQPYIECLLGVLTPEAKVVRGVKMTIYIHFIIRFMSGAIHILSCVNGCHPRPADQEMEPCC